MRLLSELLCWSGAWVFLINIFRHWWFAACTKWLVHLALYVQFDCKLFKTSRNLIVLERHANRRTFWWGLELASVLATCGRVIVLEHLPVISWKASLHVHCRLRAYSDVVIGFNGVILQSERLYLGLSEMPKNGLRWCVSHLGHLVGLFRLFLMAILFSRLCDTCVLRLCELCHRLALLGCWLHIAIFSCPSHWF